MRKALQAINLLRFAAGATTPITGPAKVAWDVTYRCNMRCKHCHLWQVREHNDLTTEEARKLISELKRLGTIHLSFSGGEPFIRSDIFDLLSYANEMGLTTAANTNGTKLASPEYAKKACETGLGTVFISLDGAGPETHNYMRGRPYAFDSALKAIDNIIEQRNGPAPQVFINTTVTQSNMDDLEKIMALGREHGIDGMTMSMLQDVGKYSPDAEVNVETDDLQGFSKRLRDMVKKSNGLIPHSNEYIDNFSNCIQNPGELYKYRCVAGYATALIHPDGEVYPCPVAFARMGSLRERSFSDIWFSGEAERIRQNIKNNKHPICWFDCIAPINVFLHNIRKLQIGKLLHRKTLSHILKKAAR